MKPDDHFRLLQRFTRGRNVPCPACGYNLREQAGPTCPECGHVLRLCVGAVAPRFGALLATIMPLIALGGFVSLILGTLTIGVLVKQQLPGGVPPTLCLVLAVGVADVLGALALYAKRTTFLSLPFAAQCAFAAGTWFLHAALVAGVLAVEF